MQPFARAWLRVGLVGLDGQRIVKFTGNLVFVSDLLAQVPEPVVRTMLLDRRHDHPWDYTPALLEKAGAKLDALHATGQPHHSGTATRAVLDALCHGCGLSAWPGRGRHRPARRYQRLLRRGGAGRIRR